MRKVGLLQEAESYPLAGRMTALLACQPSAPAVWYAATATVHDQHFLATDSCVPAGSSTCSSLTLGYADFQMFRELAAAQVTFITRAKSNLTHQVERVIVAGSGP